MASTDMSAIEKSKVTFLTLPIEIRLMIYKLLAQPPPTVNGLRFGGPATVIPKTALNPFLKSVFPWRLGWKYTYYSKYKTCLGALSATNSQLLRETAEFIVFPAVNFYFEAEHGRGRKKSAMVDMILGTQSRSPRGEVAAMCLCFTCCPGSLGCRHTTMPNPRHMRHMDVELLHHRVPWAFNQVLSEIKKPQPLHSKSFRAVIAVVEWYPKLTHLCIWFSHGDLVEWFDDPVKDLAVLQGMITKGVNVIIGIRDGSERAGHMLHPCVSLGKTLRDGGGEIVLSSVFWSSARLELRTEDDEEL